MSADEKRDYIPEAASDPHLPAIAPDRAENASQPELHDLRAEESSVTLASLRSEILRIIAIGDQESARFAQLVELYDYAAPQQEGRVISDCFEAPGLILHTAQCLHNLGICPLRSA